MNHFQQLDRKLSELEKSPPQTGNRLFTQNSARSIKDFLRQ